MTDFLLELRSEEIPARMQAKAREDLARLFAAELAKAGLVATETVTYATPRRLTLILCGLPDATQAVSEEVKGPKASAPAQALEGFLRKTGLTREQLIERDGVLFAVTQKPGRATPDVLAEAIPAVVRAFPWPKSMRWGAASASTESLRWVRPLQGIVALFGAEVVPCAIAGVESGAATVGHRFMHPGAITIGSAADYVEKLRACHVIVDQEERAAIIRDGATALAAEAGLSLVEDEGLVAENAGLTEWPVPLLGRFDADFLSVPPEVIQLTARINQKYFVCRDADGALANAFVCTANIAAADGGARIVEGNRKVLAARLSDARFFYETDLKVPLDQQGEKLSKIVFHEKLGTVHDKVERVAKLARWLVESGVVGSTPTWGADNEDVTPAQAGVSGEGARQAPHEMPASAGMTKEAFADMAEHAARLAKADLVTGMVGEFPELQGVMGGYYARAQGEPQAVWEAVRDHYKPVGQGDEVPTAPVTVAVSLADKLDTLACFFALGDRPTGSKDPFALRRAAIAVIQSVLVLGARAKLTHVLLAATFGWYEQEVRARTLDAFIDAYWGLDRARGASASLGEVSQVASERGIGEEDIRQQGHSAVKLLLDFFADRLKVQQREAGVRHDLIDAVFALGGEDDLVRLLARVRALQAFVTTADGANLLAGYKRAANILKKEAPVRVERSRDTAPSEAEAAADDDLGSARSGPSTSLGTNGGGEPAEAALIAALDAAEPAAAAAVAREDFEGAMAALATLRAPIDAFFDQVTVNDADAVKRAARLALLARVRDAVHAVADFSRIEG